MKESLKPASASTLPRDKDESVSSSGSKTLCVECQSAFDHWYSRDDWSEAQPDHGHHSIVELEHSAREGCPIYELLLRSLGPKTHENLHLRFPKAKGFIEVKSFTIEPHTAPRWYGVELHFPVIPGKPKSEPQESIDATPAGKASQRIFDSSANIIESP
jgi:hypothetical protein